MNILQAVMLGILQGFAEFLPISSSGHLVLAQKIFGVEEPSLAFDVALHLGTLIPVFVVFHKELLSLLMRPFQKMTFLLAVGTLPAVIVALFFQDALEAMFHGGQFLAIGFIITGVLLILADSMLEGVKKERDITYFDALIIGAFQAVAILPAISRSGSTITGSLFRRLDRRTAAKFSFLLSIPTILGAAILHSVPLVSGEVPLESIFNLATLFGVTAAALTGFIAINFMLKLIRDCKLVYFSYYVFALAILILFDQFVTNIVF